MKLQIPQPWLLHQHSNFGQAENWAIKPYEAVVLVSKNLETKQLHLYIYIHMYDPYIEGLKPSIFMVLGSKGVSIYIYIHMYCYIYIEVCKAKAASQISRKHTRRTISLSSHSLGPVANWDSRCLSVRIQWKQTQSGLIHSVRAMRSII